MSRQTGFTLVEIAIVLVVIGLLLGGVLKGQELVLNSQIRNTINEYNNVASVLFAYQDRYRQIPGDDDTATTRWGATSTDGDGDRQIDGDWDNNDGTEETSLFWHHLRNDGLVTGPRSNASTDTFEVPRNSFDGDIGIQEDGFGAIGAGTIIGPVICQSNIPTKASIIIDTRIDDDIGDGQGADTGSLQGGNDARLAPSAQYAGNNDYILCREL